MARLMRGSLWAKREFAEGSIPTPRTIRNWLDNGIIQGAVIDERMYVFDDQSFSTRSEVSRCVDELIDMSS